MLAAHDFEHATGGRDGHNLRMLINLVRENVMPSPNEPAPGETYRYLTEFGGAALYSHERPLLDKASIAREVPEAVARLQSMVETAKRSQSGGSDT